MLILWIRKNKTGERTCTPKNAKESFRKHNEDMKRFRLSHPEIEATSGRDIMTADGNVLATVQNVKLNKHVQN